MNLLVQTSVTVASVGISIVMARLVIGGVLNLAFGRRP
jgi:hypothetical protein